MTAQSEFLFADSPVPEWQLPDPRAGFYREVAAVWHLPLGERVRVRLRDHDFREVAGALELAQAPALPLDPREPLQLSVGGITFLSSQVQAWSLVG